LREVYAKRFGGDELDKAKKAAETAAPATSPTSAAPAATNAPASRRTLPLWQRAANLIQGEPQVADAGPFYNRLRERLEREHALPADALKQLGEERAKAVAAALAEAGVDPARANVAAAEATDSPAGKPVPLKLGLAAR
jgi:3-oxoacyl-(acyl-carrier-protein) synthase